jgi:hypothetical protein
LEKIQLQSSNNMQNNPNFNQQHMSNYYFNNNNNNVNPGAFMENQMINQNFQQRNNMNFNVNNNYSFQNNNTMNSMFGNSQMPCNINNRNQYQFQQNNMKNMYMNNKQFPQQYGNKKVFAGNPTQFVQNNPPDDQSILQSLKYVAEKYPHLININQNSAGLSNQVQSQGFPRYFVIKSFTEEDIHKVINLNKYSVYQI